MVDVASSRGSSDEGDPEHEEKVEQWRAGARKKAKRKGSFWKELPILIGVAVVLAVLIQSFLAKVYMIPSESMEQTLHGCSDGCFGDRVLVDKLVYDFSEVEPGEVVVFPVVWGGLTSAPDCAGERTPPPPGSYAVRGRLDTKISPDAPLALT